MYVAYDFKIEIDETIVYVCLYVGYVCMSVATSTICLEGEDCGRSKIACLLACLTVECRTKGMEEAVEEQFLLGWLDSMRMFGFDFLQARIDAVVQ